MTKEMHEFVTDFPQFRIFYVGDEYHIEWRYPFEHNETTYISRIFPEPIALFADGLFFDTQMHWVASPQNKERRSFRSLNKALQYLAEVFAD